MKENDMIFGTRAVIEAASAGKEIDKILVRRDLQNELARELFSIVHEMQIPVQRVPKERLDRLTRKNHQGVIAFMSAVSYQRLDYIVPFLYEEGKTPLIVLLDGITDVRNFGAIARTCECAGVDAIVIPAHNSVSVTADAVKTSAGALMNIPVCKETNLKDAVRYLKNCGYKIVAATEKASSSYVSVDYTVPAALILGGEDVGISPEILRICDDMVAIPILGKIASLNVSAAAAIMIYEVRRQRPQNLIFQPFN
ncbi:MAG: 23S rRNA (guanosine(2251)-2'-O)-methyltransferase RlmB [Dysgonamonadaceae bacterium]|jgi:23S rRNA (guanosine2251-2'-O)-methyltransferase|nr:23S rRNA (guanosine(2251)-2'-O)-methyltransferase RlmB [Dysgonamonadaceae bacterium]